MATLLHRSTSKNFSRFNLPTLTQTLDSVKKANMSTTDKNKAAKCNGSEVADTKGVEFSIDSVGWLFVKKYYSTYTTSIDTLYSFYDKKASLLHDEFPISTDETVPKQAKTVHVAAGSDAIKTHYEAQAKSDEKSKIVIESADFQESIEGSILIVVCGSWKRGSSNLWQFLQTFVLSAKGKTVYDVSNDVLRFFDLSEDYQSRSLETKSVEAPQVKADEDSTPEVAVDTKTDAEAEPSPEVTAAVEAQESSNAQETANAKGDESLELAALNSAAPTTEATDDVAIAKTDSASRTDGENAPQKHTWATLAAIQPKTTSKVASVPVSTTVVKTTPPPPKPASPSQQQASVNKFKKEEWYPIYIKQVEVDDEDLKSALIKQFGDIKFYKRNSKAALVDFKYKADQQKALDAKELIVKDNVILLEPRVHKAFNNFKQEGKKDKKPVKKNGIKKN